MHIYNLLKTKATKYELLLRFIIGKINVGIYYNARKFRVTSEARWKDPQIQNCKPDLMYFI